MDEPPYRLAWTRSGKLSNGKPWKWFKNHSAKVFHFGEQWSSFAKSRQSQYWHHFSKSQKKHGPIGWVYSLDNPTYQVQYKSMDALRFLESYLSYSLSSPSFSASSIEVHANECKQNDRWRREKSTFKRLPRWTSQSFMTVNQVKHPIQISFQAYPWISTICIYIPL